MDDRPVPKHVGLIPDGTRRWSRKNCCGLLEAYNMTMEGIVRFIDRSFRLGVNSLSIFLLSSNNLKRKAAEVDAVLTAEELLLQSKLPPLVRSLEVQVYHAGRADLLPSGYATALSALCSGSTGRVEKRLYILAAYDPLDELFHCLRSEHSNSLQMERMWVPEPIDLVIRTGGEPRLSGFLPLQCSYAELVFLPDLFNDTPLNSLTEPILSFASTKRRFGV